MRRRISLSLFAVLFLFAAKQRAIRAPETAPLDQPLHDRFSFSEPLKIAVRHLSLDLTVDFPSRTMRGTATLDFQNLAGTNQLVLDTEQLSISRVVLDDGSTASWSKPADGIFGAPLTIAIAPSTHSVTIDYSTSPFASGLNWNSAVQSFGRQQPYVYSLNEPTGARSWIPIQDTPALRLTYEATVHVPPTHLAVMTAPDNARSRNASGVYTVHMNQAIPAYLIAIAAGRLDYHAFDARTGVYAEPELMDAASWDLQYLPQMLAAAERVLGPFPFPRHDVVLMPPTFIAGGMEHPMLNFINPFGAVSGNHLPSPEPRSLLAHELAHSWAGDATTLSTWDDVWLNEGVTSYLTLRILEEMLGAERAEFGYFIDHINYQSYAGGTNPRNTILHKAIDFPWNGFGSTAYTKGELFLRTLEDVLGRTTLDSFLRGYFTRHAFAWTDDRNFVAELRDAVGWQKVTDAQVMEWIYFSGIPSNITAATNSSLYNRVLNRVNAFSANGALNVQGWTETETDLFIQLLSPNTFHLRAAQLDAALGLSLRETPPLSFLTKSINAGYAPANAAVERVLRHGGPNSWIPAIYSALVATPAGRQRALDLFAQTRDRYHPDIAHQIETLLAQSADVANAA